MMFHNTITAVFACLTMASIAYYLLCILAAWRFFSRPAGIHPTLELPPVTIMIPLYGADFWAYENYASFCRQDYPVYQIVFGVQNQLDSSVEVVHKLKSDFPGTHILLVISAETIGENPKVNNLNNMLARADHERIVIVDSDIRVGRDYLKRIVPELKDERVGLVTCPYRAGAAPNAPSKMEAIGITGEFIPGVLVARFLEGMSFALGATMATSKSRLQSIGGFKAIADYLADDFMLGNLMSKAGYEVRLSPYIVETMLSPVSFLSMLKHQIRWARGSRVCRPAGYPGSVITHGTALALLGVAAAQGSSLSLFILLMTLAARLAMGWFVGVRSLGDKILKENIWLLPVRDLLSFSIWCAGLIGRKVEWRGKLFEIVDRGKILPVRKQRSFRRD